MGNKEEGANQLILRDDQDDCSFAPIQEARAFVKRTFPGIPLFGSV